MYEFLPQPILTLGFYTGISAMAISFFLLVAVVVLRTQLILQQRRSKAFLDEWRPLMVSYAAGMKEFRHLAREIPPADRLTFVNLWLNYHESLRGDCKDNLNRLFRMLSMHQYVLTLLRRGDLRDRLVAMTALGHLQEEAAWDDLRRIAEGENAVLSLTAARALVLINPQQALPILAPLITTRTDWSPARVIHILKEAGKDACAPALLEVLRTASPTATVLLIRYLGALQSDEAMPAVRSLLHSSTNDEIAASCIRVLTEFCDPGDLPLIRSYITHPSWPVRLQAANALGRMGVREDCQRLYLLLSDEEWWVRYRAAQALANLPFITVADLEEMREKQADLYAKGILTQVLAEKQMSERQLYECQQ